MARKIGLLPGTFDPPHLGHVQLARAAMSACDLDEVWLLVNPTPAHKVAVSPYRRRLRMTQLAAEAEASLGVVAEPVQHTMAGFGQFMAMHPERDFIYLMGMDVAGHLDEWQEHEEVVRRASFAVAHRPGSSVGEVDKLRRRLGVLGEQLKLQLFEFGGYKEASSLKARTQIALGRSPGYVAPAVYDYILANGLYR